MIEKDLFEIENAHILGGISLGNERNINASINADNNGIYLSPFGQKIKIAEIVYSEKITHSRQKIILPYEDFFSMGKPTHLRELRPGIYEKYKGILIADSRKKIQEENKIIRKILDKLLN